MTFESVLFRSRLFWGTGRGKGRSECRDFENRDGFGFDFLWNALRVRIIEGQYRNQRQKIPPSSSFLREIRSMSVDMSNVRLDHIDLESCDTQRAMN